MIPRGRVLGVDLGSKRIGVAISDSDQRIATGVAVLARTRDRAADHRALADLVAGYQAVGVVVGLPLSLSGAAGPAAQAVLDELGQIRDVLPVEVETVDERFTTVTAGRGLRAAGRRAPSQRAVIDQEAAAELLHTWVARRAAAAHG
jgi:putative Holliday junction resolvase